MLQGKKWFLTFPQCPMKKDEALQNLKSHFPTTEWIIVAEEQHKDGTPHLHIALCFTQRFNSRDMKVFDKITGQHGNYQPMKNQLKCIEYVTKGGVYHAEGIDVSAVLAKKNGKFAWIAQEAMAGKTLIQLNTLDPGFILQHKRKLEEYMSWVKIASDRSKKEKRWSEIDAILALKNDHNHSIRDWLIENIKKPRQLRQKQLYLWGPPGIGKTHLVTQLDYLLSIMYVARDDGEFMDFYEDGMYDLIVMDEFSNKKTMQFMNQILDGQKCTLKKKGAQIVKSDNLPVIVISNYPLEKNYAGLYERGYLEPLVSRFLVVHAPTRIELDFVLKEEEISDVQ